MATPAAEAPTMQQPRWLATTIGLLFAALVLGAAGLATVVSYDNDPAEAVHAEDGGTDADHSEDVGTDADHSEEDGTEAEHSGG